MHALPGKGYALRVLRRFEEARTIYAQVTRLDPNNAEAYYEQAVQSALLKQRQDALSACSRCIELHQDHAYAYALKGSLPRERSAHADASICIEKALRLNPEALTGILQWLAAQS